MSDTNPVWIDGKWSKSSGVEVFLAVDPATGLEIAGQFPKSDWTDCDQALEAAAQAFETLQVTPRTVISDFLKKYADLIEANAEALAKQASQESALPFAPRLKDVEIPRTSNQLRLAATACIDGSWSQPTIDSALNIRSVLSALGPVLVIGPNNFPFAFNGMSGGDFAAALAAGNPVIVKGHPNHPNTTKMLAELASNAIQSTGLPPATVQLLYHMSPESGLRMIADRRLASVAFTGSKSAGLSIKETCDKAGKPVYLEMSSVNPVVILPGAIEERGEALAEEFSGSCMMGAGQFCTNPGFVILCASSKTEAFIGNVVQRFGASPGGTLLAASVRDHLAASVTCVQKAGAQLLVGGNAVEDGGRIAFQNTVLRVSGTEFLNHPEALQTEMFGPVSMFVVVEDLLEAQAVIAQLEGNLTGTIYTSTDDRDDSAYQQMVRPLRQKVGRLLNNKMPTGVAVSLAMNHGGPYPSTGHPGFTAVGIPASMKRFGALQCYDNVRTNRLPEILQDQNPAGLAWRLIDGQWTQGDVISAKA